MKERKNERKKERKKKEKKEEKKKERKHYQLSIVPCERGGVNVLGCYGWKVDWRDKRAYEHLYQKYNNLYELANKCSARYKISRYFSTVGNYLRMYIPFQRISVVFHFEGVLFLVVWVTSAWNLGDKRL